MIVNEKTKGSNDRITVVPDRTIDMRRAYSSIPFRRNVLSMAEGEHPLETIPSLQ